MASKATIAQILYEANQILDRAKIITVDAPFWMGAEREEFAKIVIDGDKATLSWPEVESGYYNSCSIEIQSVTFPSELLLMSIDEIKVWKKDQRAKYDAEQKAQQDRDMRERAERQTALELQTLAVLQKKYGKRGME